MKIRSVIPINGSGIYNISSKEPVSTELATILFPYLITTIPVVGNLKLLAG